MGTHNCEQNCTNTVGSYNCSCNTGYSLDSNGRNCTGISLYVYAVYITFLLTDIDECVTNNGGCSQNCSNNFGTFICSCNTGYTLFSDGLTCNGEVKSCTCTVFVNS